MKKINFLGLSILMVTLFFGAQKVKAENCNIQCFRYDPVCGVNGQTYGCGLPEINCHGIAIAYNGACQTNVCLLSDKKSKLQCATSLEKEAFEKYLRNNINKLSSQKASSGMVFLLTKINWQANRVALVSYNDGHKFLTAKVQMAVIYRQGQIKSVQSKSFKILTNK